MLFTVANKARMELETRIQSDKHLQGRQKEESTKLDYQLF